ncbi:MAG TPA: hypothetical protein VNV82_15260 [Bryobacteraceae bacterium]|jgi:hypothetical protein|nr:hypothetical protein [Bryobacteraceae bacterium]
MPVELMLSGPAHTWGDVMVYLLRQKIPSPGDIAFYYFRQTYRVFKNVIRSFFS